MNYGWPLASYGSHYIGQKDMNKFTLSPSPHNKFKEPIFFKNAIAISQILHVPKNFTKENEDSLFLASMKVNNDYGETINLYHLKFKNEKITIYDLIPIGERIRDLVYDRKKQYSYYVSRYICQHWNFVSKINLIFFVNSFFYKTKIIKINIWNIFNFRF